MKAQSIEIISSQPGELKMVFRFKMPFALRGRFHDDLSTSDVESFFGTNRIFERIARCFFEKWKMLEDADEDRKRVG